MRRLAPFIAMIALSAALFVTPADALGPQKISFSQGAVACSNSYYNLTGSGIIHHWRTDCVDVGGFDALHIMFKPYSGTKIPSGSSVGLIGYAESWTLTGGSGTYTDGGSTYTDLPGDEGDLDDIFTLGQKYAVFIYRASDEAWGPWHYSSGLGDIDFEVWEGSPARPAGGNFAYEDVWGTFGLDVTCVSISADKVTIGGFVDSGTHYAMGTPARIEFSKFLGAEMVSGWFGADAASTFNPCLPASNGIDMTNVADAAYPNVAGSGVSVYLGS